MQNRSSHVVAWSERLRNVQKCTSQVQSVQKYCFSLLNMQIFHVLLAFVEVVALAPYLFVQLKRAGFPTASPACTFRSSPVPGMNPVESDRVSAIECMGWLPRVCEWISRKPRSRFVNTANGFHLQWQLCRYRSNCMKFKLALFCKPPPRSQQWKCPCPPHFQKR